MAKQDSATFYHQSPKECTQRLPQYSSRGGKLLTCNIKLSQSGCHFGCHRGKSYHCMLRNAALTQWPNLKRGEYWGIFPNISKQNKSTKAATLRVPRAGEDSKASSSRGCHSMSGIPNRLGESAMGCPWPRKHAFGISHGSDARAFSSVCNLWQESFQRALVWLAKGSAEASLVLV